ncbi:unnamed protein product [Diamesa serratosioi]
MIQFDANGYQKVENESNTTLSKDLKDNLCDDKENTISNHKQTRQHNNLSESVAMADCEKQSEMEDSGEDLNGNAQNADYNSSNKTSIVDSREEREDDEIVDGVTDPDPEPNEINFNHKKSSLGLELESSQVSSAAILNEANAIFNNGMFQPGQMSMQTFQNAIAQFTANAIANNMDNETVMKNLSILQSALFTLQQQQFLQFQLIQHLQSQLVKKGSDADGSCDKTNNKLDSDDEEMDSKSMDKGHDEIDEEDGEIDEEEMERQNEYHKRLMENKHFNKMDTIIKDNENRLTTRSMSIENGNDGEGEDVLKKAEEGLNAFTNNFVLSSNIITDHDPAVQISESTNSLAMLEKKAQEVLNSASQGILSNNLLDELAFANDKSPNGRTDSSLFKHRCRYCGKIFGSDSSLQIHIRSHTGERPYKCNVCGSRFTTKGNLKVHFQRHSDKYPHIPMNPNPCLVCKKVLSCRSALQMHYRVHTGERPFRCKICGRSFTTKGNLKTHMSVHHSSLFKHRCRYCGKIFGSDSSLQIHLRSHTGERPYKCNVCGSRFTTKGNLKVHFERHSDKYPHIPMNPHPVPCLVCKKVLSCRSALQMHYRVHTGDRPFRCKICGRSFTTKGNLKTHMSVHRIKPPMRTLHQCPVCHQKFSNIFVLQQHIRLHTGEMTDLTPDQIRAAEIREFPDHALDIHYRSHTKERPFKCTICDRGFSTKGNMKQHMLTHKIRDMFGNSNSGDESHISSGGGHTSDSQSTTKTNSHDLYDDKKDNEMKKWSNSLNEIPENIAAI